jgi:hypothetical protein
VAACEGPAGQGGWRAADRQLCNDYLSYLADRRYSPASVRAYAFDLVHFARWLAGQDTGVDGVDTETIVCLLIGGAVSDRYDRRVVMLVADVVRALVLAARAALSLTGALRLWELLVIAVAYGCDRHVRAGAERQVPRLGVRRPALALDQP